MFNSFRAELIKMRHLRLWFIAGGVGIALSAIIWSILSSTLTRVANEKLAEMPWQNAVIGDVTNLIILALPAMVIIVTALVFFVEHRNDMWKQLRVTPKSMLSIYVAKFIVVQLVVVFGITVFFASAATAWIWLATNEMRAALPVSNAEVLQKLSLMAIQLYLSLLPAALIQFALSAYLSNILYPVGIGIALTFTCLLLYGPSNVVFFPYAYPGTVIISNLALPESSSNEASDQFTDTDYRAPVKAFYGVIGIAKDKDVVILIDEAHGNRHGLGTINNPGTLRWIAAPAEEAGIKVKSHKATVSREILSEASLLVIAGATTPPDEADFGAFTGLEVEQITGWVKDGGSLLLLTDHPPFGKNVRSLAQSFGVDFSLDNVSDPTLKDPRAPNAARMVFTKLQGLIEPYEITKGVERVITYGGQGIWRTEKDTIRLLKIPPTAQTSGEKSVALQTKGENLAQLLAFKFGRGRVVISGETGLFTAQRKNDGLRIGVADKETDNEQLVINTFLWLLNSCLDSSSQCN